MTDTTVTADTLREMLAPLTHPIMHVPHETSIRVPSGELRQIITLALEALALRTPSEGEGVETAMLHLLVAKLDGYSVELVNRETGVRRLGFSVGPGRSVALSELAALATPSPHKDGAEPVGFVSQQTLNMLAKGDKHLRCSIYGAPVSIHDRPLYTTPPDEGSGLKVTDEMCRLAMIELSAHWEQNTQPTMSIARAALTAALQVRS